MAWILWISIKIFELSTSYVLLKPQTKGLVLSLFFCFKLHKINKYLITYKKIVPTLRLKLQSLFSCFWFQHSYALSQWSVYLLTLFWGGLANPSITSNCVKLLFHACYLKTAPSEFVAITNNKSFHNQITNYEAVPGFELTTPWLTPSLTIGAVGLLFKGSSHPRTQNSQWTVTDTYLKICVQNHDLLSGYKQVHICAGLVLSFRCL